MTSDAATFAITLAFDISDASGAGVYAITVRVTNEAAWISDLDEEILVLNALLECEQNAIELDPYSISSPQQFTISDTSVAIVIDEPGANDSVSIAAGSA